MAFPDAMTEPIERFEIDVSDLVLEDLVDRLAATRFPDEIDDHDPTPWGRQAAALNPSFSLLWAPTLKRMVQS